MIRVAVNGVGRIGRATFKQMMENPAFEVLAVNDLMRLEDLKYLLQYDSAYGRYEKTIQVEENGLRAGENHLRYLSEKDPANLPWKEMNIDLVFECTGFFRTREGCQKHLDAGAKRVILSAPAQSDDIPTVVPGVNQADAGSKIISTASCTTNCIAPVVEIIGRRVGIKKAMMTTVHAHTSTQSILDGPNKKMRRGRSGAHNLVPTTTGAAQATTRALPQYKDRFDGVAVRAPVIVGSVADLVFLLEKESSVEQINSLFKEEAESQRYRGILGVTEDPYVSSDIIKDDRASVVDLGMTRIVDGDLLKIMSWYDNEWGYSAQMIREALYLNKEEIE